MFQNIKKILGKVIRIINPKKEIEKLDTIDYKKISHLMNEKGLLEEYENELNNFDEIEKLMNNKTSLHGINHIVRVLFNVYALVALEKVNEKDKKIIVAAAKLHDISRISDSEDETHGANSAIKAREILKNKDFSAEEIDEICFIIKEHSLSRNKNNEDIERLPKNLRENYKYCLNLLKDADKLDRVRIGDLDSNRLTTDSAKRLISVSKENFETNRYMYNKKLQVYPYNENEAKDILEEIKKENSELEIGLNIIKTNFSQYKALKEQGKLKWIKSVKEDITLQDFLEISNIVSIEDEKFLEENFMIGYKIILKAIKKMGIENYLKIKSTNELEEFLCFKNYPNVVHEVTEEEYEFFRQYKKNDILNSSYEQFFLFHNFFLKNDSKKIDMLLLNCKDFYICSESQESYKWIEDTIILPTSITMKVIEDMDSKLLLDLKEKNKYLLNVILTGVVDLQLLSDKENNKENIEKLLKNYCKFNLNIDKEKDVEQMKKLLLDLPDDLGKEYENIIQECIVGRFKMFNLDSFEQIRDYKTIIDKKILERFKEVDDIDELRNMILETKIKNIDNLKRDIYFYYKYTKNKTEIIDLFQKLFETSNKEELLQVYIRLNEFCSKFELDDDLQEVRETLSDISKTDVTNQMNNMQEGLNAMVKTKIEGQEVIDLTGRDFNLLISVIGATGSPYLVEYYNNKIEKLKKNENNLSLMKFNIGVRIGLKRRINKRYRVDPLKNKQRCVSSIDQDFVGHIKSANKDIEKDENQINEKLILAYFPQKSSDIYWMGNDDLQTEYDKERKDPSRKRVPHKDNIDRVCNLKLQDLNATTIGDDNEIIIDSYPGAVMCFDSISNISKKTAKKLNIPILYIDSKQQFKIMEEKLNNYYLVIKGKLTETNQISNDFFQSAFNTYELNENIIHRAFKIANSFSYLDEGEYPKEQIIKIFDEMKNLVTEFLKKCDDKQKREIQKVMKKEANPFNLRYGRYDRFIDFGELNKLVSIEEGIEEDIIL